MVRLAIEESSEDGWSLLLELGLDELWMKLARQDSSKMRLTAPVALRVLPAPNLAHPVGHVDLLLHHVQNPWVLQHLCRRRAQIGVAHQATSERTLAKTIHGRPPYPHSRLLDKVLHLVGVCDILLIFELGGLSWEWIDTREKRISKRSATGGIEGPGAGARTSFWVMYIMSSIAARSLGNGNRFVTSSSREMPVDHTSDRIVYSTPDRRSGCASIAEGERRVGQDQVQRFSPPCTGSCP